MTIPIYDTHEQEHRRRIKRTLWVVAMIVALLTFAAVLAWGAS